MFSSVLGKGRWVIVQNVRAVTSLSLVPSTFSEDFSLAASYPEWHWKVLSSADFHILITLLESPPFTSKCSLPKSLVCTPTTSPLRRITEPIIVANWTEQFQQDVSRYKETNGGGVQPAAKLRWKRWWKSKELHQELSIKCVIFTQYAQLKKSQQRKHVLLRTSILIQKF